MAQETLSSVEKVRDELRRLGYLQSGIDRFVLSGASKGSPVGTLLAASSRVGVLGGLVLGPALTLAAVSLDPRLLSEPRDVLVLGCYLVVLLVGFVAAASLFAGFLAASSAKRLPRVAQVHLSRNVGLLIGVLSLVYLALWWRSHASSTAAPAQALALVVGLGLAVLLARFGSLASVAVLSAGGLQVPEARLSRERVVPLLALAVFCLGGGLFASSVLASRGGRKEPDFAVVPTGLRVRVLGIDGLDLRMALSLAGSGTMPRLQALLPSFAWGALRAEPEKVPAIVWTTIATGRGPDSHGIQSAAGRRLAGLRTPVSMEQGGFSGTLVRALDLLRITRATPPSSVLRSAKTFWNVASEKGLRVGIVNWWATWPADRVNGFLVSDRAFFKLERGGAADREVFPESSFESLRPLASPAESPARSLDRFSLEAERKLEGSEDLLCAYLPGLDIVTLQQMEPSSNDLASLEARLATVKAYYTFIDSVLGAQVDSLQGNEVLLLVGDPGRFARGSAEAQGFWALRGSGVAAGRLPPSSERDIAPTVLHLLGLPISRELDGRVLEGALDEGFRRAHPVRRVAFYAPREISPPAESGFDREMVEELRSLGYLQ